MTEWGMIEKLKKGDPRGLEGLMDRYTPYVSAVAWGILRSAMTPEDGEEVVADVFLCAWNQRDDLRPGKVKAWLGAVARNRAKNKLRERGETLPLEEDALDLPGPDDPAGEAQRAEDARLVRRAVDSLDARDREVFLRHYYYAQTVREIAGAMDMNEATVKTRLRRGREKLKQTLTKEGFEYEV